MHSYRTKRSDDKCPTCGVFEQRPKGRNLEKEAFKEYLRQNIYQTRRFW